MSSSISNSSLAFNTIIARYPLALFYKGNFEDNPTFSIVDIVERNLSLYLEKQLIRKLAYLVIEAVQNIEKYSKGHGSSEDFVLVFSDHTTFHVITQNRIGNNDIPALKERLDLVNSRHAEELDELYRETLQAGEHTSLGAGLGLIDMVRKSGNSLGYAFEPGPEDFSRYRLSIQIPIAEGGERIDHTGLMQLLASRFANSKSALFYTGDFSNSFLQAFLYMVRTLKGSGNPGADSIFHYTLIEMTQNIKRHGKKSYGKIPAHLCLEWLDGTLCISTLNLVEPEEVPVLAEKLNFLRDSSKEEIDLLNQERLSDMEHKGGLGLTDITRLNHPNRIGYDLVKVPNLGEAISLTLYISL